MCKCCQHCMESCYWHLIEKRFCFDESIALYQEPLEKEEKNNNVFDNMAFYDSVSVIAGRAIVTIDPLPEKDNKLPIVQQPKRLKWQEQIKRETKNEDPVRNIPSWLVERSAEESDASSSFQEKLNKMDEARNETFMMKKSVSFENILSKPDGDDNDPTGSISKSVDNLTVPDATIRKKSLAERRLSKSLHLKIDFPKELPIIRQNSMPKFYLDTPEENQTESTLFKTPLTALQSPMITNDVFSYDLYSVVQIEKTKNQENEKDVVSIHRSSSRLSQIKGRIKLKKSKSTVSSSNVPHSNYI